MASSSIPVRFLQNQALVACTEMFATTVKSLTGVCTARAPSLHCWSGGILLFQLEKFDAHQICNSEFPWGRAVFRFYIEIPEIEGQVNYFR